MEPAITTTWNSPRNTPIAPQTGELHLWLIDLRLTDGVKLAERLLSSDEQQRSERMRLPTEQRRFILARGAMRSILSAYIGVPGNQIIFRYGDKGKPAIDHPQSPIKFNLSHSKDIALLAVAEKSVGIDLEPLSQRKGLRQIAFRVFSPEIVKKLQLLQDEAFTLAFFRHWTELEAKVKALGGGIFSETQQITRVRHRHFQPIDGWIAAVAMEGKPPPPEKWSTYRFSFNAQ
ncbi:MAG: 4'-phosphopantetheinyl transferase superfamily protein [Sedimenticola sp.]